MAAQLKVYYTTAARLNELEVRGGQLIFVNDLHQIFLDMNGIRIGYNSTVVFNTDDERESYADPVEGFYFVLDTNSMWFYSDSWTRINNGEASEIVYFGDVDTFPEVGRTDVLYVAPEAIYRYDDMLMTYIAVSTKQEWGTLQ